MEEQPKKEKKSSTYIRFSSMGLQMGVIIGFFAWLGTYLDKKQANDTPVWTIVLSLFGITGALYLVIKEVSKMNKD
jgi:F0F1-type ATP synthase assembly protein I